MTDDVGRAYEKAQKVRIEERPATRDELSSLSTNWKDPQIPDLQRTVVNVQLENLRAGKIDPVFVSLISILKKVDTNSFTLLDAACASGYYHEVIKTLDSRNIEYHGCDYSEEMVKTAKAHYPEIDFQVQDLTSLAYADSRFDVVLMSGVLEHIPSYEKCIHEVCRIAKRNVIVHRCPLTSEKANEFTIGSQYSIETPRIFFAQKRLLDDFRTNGFVFQDMVSTYPTPEISFSQRLKAVLKQSLGMKLDKQRTVNTLLFRRI